MLGLTQFIERFGDIHLLDVVELGLSVADGSMKYDDVLSWIKRFEKI